MVTSDELLIVIDPGHGGWDNGASFEGRLEKDYNLRLGLAVRDQLLARGVPVLMTRDTDVYLTLAERAAMANEARADLFISLHRNSYFEQTPSTMGVENFIYLTAPPETSGRAAQLVLDNVVAVGVQDNRGVRRGNYYVLRRTIMPAMLLEMGFIINEIDNQLFDDYLEEYAAAIAQGVVEYFELPGEEVPGLPPPEGCPACPVCPQALVMQAQLRLNESFGLSIPLTGLNDEVTRRNAVMALQMALNNDLDAGLSVNGELEPFTLAAFRPLLLGSRGSVVLAVQLAMMLKGYYPGYPDGIFGPLTQAVVLNFQRDNNLIPDGILGPQTLLKLYGE